MTFQLSPRIIIIPNKRVIPMPLTGKFCPTLPCDNVGSGSWLVAGFFRLDALLPPVTNTERNSYITSKTNHSSSTTMEF